MEPGTGDVHSRVLQAIGTTMVEHMEPAVMNDMNDVMHLLRYVFATENELTVSMSGTGSAGMETVFVNLLDPGDEVIVGVNGLFGERMVDVIERCDAKAIPIHADWGDVFDPEQIEAALKNHPHAKCVALVHAEKSTGARQPLEKIAKIVHNNKDIYTAEEVT